MEYTENMGLRKPGSNDNMEIADLNYNFDQLDTLVFLRKKSTLIYGGTNSCVINIPTNGSFFMIVSMPGVNLTWVGIVYCASTGTVTIQQINQSTGITAAAAQNKVTFSFTYGSDTTLYLTYIPFRGDANVTF